MWFKKIVYAIDLWVLKLLTCQPKIKTNHIELKIHQILYCAQTLRICTYTNNLSNYHDWYKQSRIYEYSHFQVNCIQICIMIFKCGNSLDNLNIRENKSNNTAPL